MAVRTSKEDRYSLDQQVLEIIKASPKNFRIIMAMVRWPEGMKLLFMLSSSRTRTDKDRILDKSLQRLRKAGKIEFSHGKWRFVQRLVLVPSDGD